MIVFLILVGGPILVLSAPLLAWATGGEKAAGVVGAILLVPFAVLLVDYHSTPASEQNDRSGLGSILAIGCWIVVIECVAVIGAAYVARKAINKDQF